MALLARVACAAMLFAGCYSPELRDCTVSCASSADCSGAQVCNANHFCAAKDVACSAVNTPVDASIGDASERRDAATIVDAGRPPIDAPAPVTLRLFVDGGGGTLTFGMNSCTDSCTYQVAYGTPITVTASANGNHTFVAWSQGPCTGSLAHTCSVTPTMPLTVAAKFVHGGDN